MSFSYDEHAKRCAPDELLQQICRTHQGKPISAEQINLIVNAIKVGLALEANDSVLEIACGNGSLSHYLFSDCKRYLGFDISEFLVDVAKRNFQQEPDYVFFSAPLLEGLAQATRSVNFNKLLCYAAVQYFNDAQLIEKLKFIKEHFPAIKRVFWGNIPDKGQANKFFVHEMPDEAVLNDTNTAIGKWRSQDDIKRIATEAGWKIECYKMPKVFYASEYRFDAVLTL